MRRMVLSLVSAAALTLAGCNAPSPTAAADGNTPASANTAAGRAASSNGAAPTAIPGQVTGTVSLRQPAQLSANARLDIRLVDITAGAATAGQALASKTVMPANQFPQDFELTFDPVERSAPRFAALPSTPSSERVLALILGAGTTVQQVESLLQRVGAPLLESVSIQSDYRGPELAVGTRSVAFRLTFRAPDRTLRDLEIDAIEARMLAALAAELGIQRRDAGTAEGRRD